MRQRIFSPPLQLVAGWSRRSGERVQDLLGKLGAANRTEAVARARGTRFWLIPDAPLAIFLGRTGRGRGTGPADVPQVVIPSRCGARCPPPVEVLARRPAATLRITDQMRNLMTTTTGNPDRTAHLLALMKQGDDAFNSQNVAAMNAVHHPDMIARIPGSAEPIRGRAAHAAAMEQFFRIFPDVRVHNDPYPIQFGRGDWITVISRTTGTFTGEMTRPDGTVIPPTGKAFDLEFSQTVKWDGDQVIEILAFWDTALQAQQIGLA